MKKQGDLANKNKVRLLKLMMKLTLKYNVLAEII